MGISQFSTMRKPVAILCLLLTVAYFVSVKFFYQLPFSLSRFMDMRDAYAAYAQDAEFMDDNGYMNGVDYWDFAPARNMTRAEMCALLLKLRNVDVDKLKNLPAPNSRFTDLNQTDWYPATVDLADKMHILPFDITDNQFHPNDPVTRGEVAQAIADLFGLKATSDPVSVTDIAGNPHEDAIKVVLQHAYASGVTPQFFKPNDPANRAVVARLFHYSLVNQRPELAKPKSQRPPVILTEPPGSANSSNSVTNVPMKSNAPVTNAPAGTNVQGGTGK